MVLPQLISPVGQPQTPLVHTAPDAQVLLQLPQWSGSVCSFTQPSAAPQ